MRKFSWRGVIWWIVVLALIWLLRPFFHPLLMLFIVSPLKAIFIIVLIAGIITFFRKLGKIQMVPAGVGNYTFKASNNIPPAIIATYVLGIVALCFALYFENEIRFLITSKQIDYSVRQDLPTFTPARLIPKQVAKRYADDSFQNPQEYLGDSQIVLENGKLSRVFPRYPDGGLLYFLNKMTGFVTVEVDTLDRKVAIEDQKFQYSDGIGVFDNLYYHLLMHKYFVQYSSEPIYLKNDQGKWVTVVPYMNYKGFPFRVPYWAGVVVVDSAGNITDYTPDQAQQVSYLKGNRIYPKELTLYYSQSYSYRGGLLNKWFLHKNQIEVVSLPSDEAVLHVPTDEGFKEMVVAEPYGRSYGIYKIFFFDATTGKREVIEYDQNSQLTGPVAAADYIKREFPTYSWDTFSLTEPRPMKIGGEFYWLLSIVPNDSAGIAKTVLFNAKTNKVYGIDDEAAFNRIIQTGQVVSETTSTPSTTSTVTATDNSAQIKAKIDSIEEDLNDLKALVQ